MSGCTCETLEKKRDGTHFLGVAEARFGEEGRGKNMHYSWEDCDRSCFFCLFPHAFFHLSCDAKFLTCPHPRIALMLHIISGFTAKSLLTPACLQIRILQIRGIQRGGRGARIGGWGGWGDESGLNIICTAPENVTKSFELTEKMRKLIASSWFIYTR